MAHPEQREFVRLVSTSMSRYFNNVKVLEIGSLDINGSIRDYFKDCDFTGIDISEGKNVNIVCQGQDYNAPDETFDQVISCEVLEHNPFWLETFNNMSRMTKAGGLVLMTCATIGRREHGTTKSQPNTSPLSVDLGWDYYKNLTSSDILKKANMECFSCYHFWVNWNSFDLYFCGIKKGENAPDAKEWDLLLKSIDDYISTQNNRKIHSYRKFMANFFGDCFFRIIHKINDMSKYMHGE